MASARFFGTLANGLRSNGTVRSAASRYLSPSNFNTSLTAKTAGIPVSALAVGGGVSWLNLHEYQSKQLMEKYNVNTQKFGVATNGDEAAEITKRLGVDEVVVKAQIHAGGRGKGVFEPSGFAGGVHLATTPEAAAELTDKMVGNNLITKQTPPEGVRVNQVMVAEAVDITNELYFAILMDRAHDGPVIVASKQGGMDIEAVAEATPEAIIKQPIDIVKGITRDQSTDVAKKLGFESDAKITEAAEQIEALYNLFIESDATQVEINPLAETKQNKLYAIDAKINFDDSAAFRQKELFAQADPAEEDPREVAASKFGLNYIGLTGNIGCLVNGAGLAMATMDIIKLNGGSPANFLDVGGGATAPVVAEAFKILIGDPSVKSILVNIFGGIMRCDTIAEGIVEAAKAVNLQIPLVVRLEGTNAEQGLRILNESGLALTPALNLDEAASLAVKSVN